MMLLTAADEAMKNSTDAPHGQPVSLVEMTSSTLRGHLWHFLTSQDPSGQLFVVLIGSAILIASMLTCTLCLQAGGEEEKKLETKDKRRSTPSSSKVTGRTLSLRARVSEIRHSARSARSSFSVLCSADQEIRENAHTGSTQGEWAFGQKTDASSTATPDHDGA